MKRICNSAVLILLLQLFINSLYAQSYTPFKKIDGTISNTIYCVYQDRKGYIWFGTEEGVCRYDGYEFSTFTKDDGLSDNEVFQIYEDSKERLWFITFNGEPTLYDNGRILTSSNTSFLKKIKDGSMGRGFFEVRDSMWYYTSKNAYLLVNDSCVRKVPAERITKYNNASFIECRSYDCIPVLLTHEKVYYPVTNQVHQIPVNSMDLLPDTKCIAIGKRLFFNRHDRLIVYDINNSKTSTIQISKESINGFYYDDKQRLIYVLTPNSIYSYSPYTGAVYKLCDHNLDQANFIFTDKHGNRWLLNYKQGAYFSKKVKTTIIDYNTIPGVKTAYSLGFDNKYIYAGYVNCEYMYWDGKPRFHKPAYTVSLDKVYGFCKLKEKYIAIAGSNLFDVNKPDEMLGLHSIKAMAVGKDYAFVGYSFYVLKISVDELYQGHLHDYGKPWPKIYSSRVNSILAIGDDTVYLAALDGLKMVVNDKQVSQIWMKEKVCGVGVNKIARKRNRILFATAGAGIGIIENNKCYTIDVGNGLPTNICNSIFAEDDSVLWVATNSGVSKITYHINGSKIQSEVSNYTTANGLLSQQIIDLIVVSDTLWMATKEGVCFIQKEQLLQNGEMPELIIEGLTINNTKQTLKSVYTLPYYQNNISVNFVGISYQLENTVLYKYKLEHGDVQDWIVTKSRRIDFSNLSPGTYLLSIATSNGSGKWNAGIKTIKFLINPPVWSIWWVQAIGAIVLIMLLFLAFISRIARLKREHRLENIAINAEKEKLHVEKKLVELEQKALSLQMNPHFIFNSINTIKGFYTGNSKKEGDLYVEKFASLMRIILNNSAVDKVRLSEEIRLLYLYLELAAIRRDHSFKYAIHIENGINPQQISIPSMLLQPFVENAIIHGIASMKGDGMITIKFATIDGMLKCLILDNGIGIAKSKINNKYRLHNSMGIEIVRQRLVLLSENSRLTIEDVMDGTGNVCGTSVTIVLPY